MANIYGTSRYSWLAQRWIANDDRLFGTSTGDYIDAGGGNDVVYSGLGNDTVYGGSGNDWLEAGDGSSAVAAWGNDWVSGGDGNDTFHYALTTSTVTLSGDAGNDIIYGGYNSDNLYGGADVDQISGNNGNDYIIGGTGGDYLFGNADADYIRGNSGVDTIDGGTGNDWIVGGADGDWLTGGSGYDVFIYETAYESGLTWATADTIKDFNQAYDYLDFAQAGTQFNYVETSYYAESFDMARSWAGGQIAAGARYAFASGGAGHDGYLFADADGNGTMDTGIELLGVGTSFFDYRDII